MCLLFPAQILPRKDSEGAQGGKEVDALFPGSLQNESGVHAAQAGLEKNKNRNTMDPDPAGVY